LSKECKNERWAACKNQIDEALSYLYGVKSAMDTLGMSQGVGAITTQQERIECGTGWRRTPEKAIQ